MRLNCCANDAVQAGFKGIAILCLSVLSGFMSTANTSRTPSISDIVPDVTVAELEVTETTVHTTREAGVSGESGVNLTFSPIFVVNHGVPATTTWPYVAISYGVPEVRPVNVIGFPSCLAISVPSAL